MLVAGVGKSGLRMGRDLLVDVAERVLHRLDNAINVPREDFLSLWSIATVGSNVTETIKLLLAETLGEAVQRLRLGTPFQRFGQLLLSLEKISIIGIQVLLEDDLGRYVRVGIC